MSVNGEEFSEADILQELLGKLDDHGTFQLGLLMGIMGKSLRHRIAKLEQELSLEKEKNDGGKV